MKRAVILFGVLLVVYMLAGWVLLARVADVSLRYGNPYAHSAVNLPR